MAESARIDDIIDKGDSMRAASTLFMFALCTAALADGRPARAGSSWMTLADCATAYRANWLDRRSDPNRAAQMKAMIQDQSEDYRKSAASAYATSMRVSSADALRAVGDYIKSNLKKFETMDGNGRLDSFIDNCPQPES